MKNPRLQIFGYAFITTLTFVGNVCAFGAVSNTPTASTPIQNTVVANTGVGTAKMWGLTDQEWARYQELMQGPDGHYYPQLTPPEVLGMEAQTPQELQHFAEIDAQQEHVRIAKELAFNNAFYDAMKRLYPDEPVIRPHDISAFNPVQSATQNKTYSLQAGDHLVLFINPGIGIDFETLPSLIADIKKHSGVTLDIYCVGQVTDSDISQWAALNNIPKNLVSQDRITLNHDTGQLLQKTAEVGLDSLPYVLLVRNGQSHRVSIGSLS